MVRNFAMKGLELWHTSSRDSEIREREVPKISNDTVLIKSLYSLVSAGTECIIAKGLVPESVMEAMRVPYMKGSFTFPCTYGYSLVGEIIEGPLDQKGKKVHLMHPHQNYAVANMRDLYFIPDRLPLRHAILASNMETALTAAWDGEVSIGDEVMLVGFGIIGALLAGILSSHPHIRLTVIENNEDRLRAAEELGFAAISNGRDLDSRYDIAFNCSGSSDGLQLCIDKVACEGRVVELSWYGTRSVSLYLGQEFHSKRKRIISSQVSSIPAFKMSRWDRERRKKLVFDILKNPYFGKIITDEVSFDNTPTLFRRIRKDERRGLGIMITY